MKFALGVLLFGIAVQSVVSIDLEHLSNHGCHGENIEYSENEGRKIVLNAPSHEHNLGRKIIETPVYGSGLKDTITKGRPEIVMHQQPTIVVHRPPTTVRINHAPMIVKSSPIVYHRGGDKIHHPIIKKYHKRPIHIRPYVVKVVKPIEQKVLVPKHRESYNGGLERDIVLNGKGGLRLLGNHGHLVENDDETIKTKIGHGYVQEGSCGCNSHLIGHHGNYGKFY